MSATMRAMVIRRFGPPEVFEATELPRPEAGPGEVLIRVAASSVNPVDAKIRRGEVPVGPEFPAVLHADVAGVVAAVGDGVGDFAPGDEVYGCAGGVRGLPGALAQYMVADARLVAPAPRSLPLVESAALPLVSITAWEALVERGAVQSGENILVHGGTGGVGHVAVQLGKWRGARVVTTCGSDLKQAQARALGADATLDYTASSPEDWVDRQANGVGFDLVFDTVGGQVLFDSIAATRIKGRVVTISGRSTLDIKPLFQKGLSLHTVFMLLPMLTGTGREAHGAILREIAGLVDAGRLRPLLDVQRFGFSQVAEAHARLESGQAMGKILLVNDL